MKRSIPFGLILIIVSLACGLPFLSPQPTEEPVFETPTSRPVATPTDKGIVHVTQPNELPAERINNAGDHDSSTTAKNKHAPGGIVSRLGSMNAHS